MKRRLLYLNREILYAFIIASLFAPTGFLFAAPTNVNFDGWTESTEGSSCYEYGVDTPLMSFDYVSSTYTAFFFNWDEPENNNGAVRTYNAENTGSFSHTTDFTDLTSDPLPDIHPVHVYQVRAYDGSDFTAVTVDFIVQDAPCDSEEPVATSSYNALSTASTTAILTNLVFGQTIMLVIMSIGLTGYVWNSFVRKKSWQK